MTRSWNSLRADLKGRAEHSLLLCKRILQSSARGESWWMNVPDIPLRHC